MATTTETTQNGKAAATTGRARARAAGFRSLYDERSVEQLQLTGALPTWLQGQLVRVTPADLDPGGRTLRHWFDGLAMLNAFTVRDGKVGYASRYLDTEARRTAQRTGELPLGFATDPCRKLFKRVMTLMTGVNDNTNVNLTKLGDRYIAMTELPVPVEFDAETLGTTGRARWQKTTGNVTTAHPHLDPTTGELVNYAAHLGPRSSYRVYAATQVGGTPRVIANVPVKEPAYMHSFAITERFVVLAEFPLVINPTKMLFSSKAFIDNYHWKPERGTRFTVVDKATRKVQGRHEGEAFFSFHHVNAFEDGGRLNIDLVGYDDPAIIGALEVEKLRGDETRPPGARLQRYRVALDGSGVEREELADAELELPRIDYRRVNGKPYRHVYAAGFAAPQSDWFDQLVKVDVTTGTTTRWSEPGTYPGEPVYVARPGATTEDDGVVVSVVLDPRTERSSLVVLDAKTLEELARAEAPHAIPFGFHGQFFR